MSIVDSGGTKRYWRDVPDPSGLLFLYSPLPSNHARYFFHISKDIQFPSRQSHITALHCVFVGSNVGYMSTVHGVACPLALFAPLKVDLPDRAAILTNIG